MASVEAGCSNLHKDSVVGANFDDTMRTLVVTGRPLRVRVNEYIADWEKRPQEVKKLTDMGVVPMSQDMDDGKDVDFPFLMGQVSGVIKNIKPAGQIVEEMVKEACETLREVNDYMMDSGGRSKL